LKEALVASQVVLSCVFLGVEGVYVRALEAMQEVDLGFDVERLAFVETDAAFAGYTTDQIAILHERLRQRVASLPGVEWATLMVGPPPGANGAGLAIVDGYQPIEGESTYLPWIWVGPEYFDAVGIPLLRGRGFGEVDRLDTPPVALVNESLARRYFGTSDPVGRRLSVSEGSGSVEGSVGVTELEVIGVVPDVRTSLQEPPGPMIYRSFLQGAATPSTVLVRTSGDPASLVLPLQWAVRDLDASIPIIRATTLSQRVTDELGMQRAVVALLGVLGALGLGLASLGLYAVVAFTVSRRSREIGIRTALGAQRTKVIWALSKDITALMAGALAVGLCLSWLLVRILGTLVSNLGQAESVNLNAAPTADPMAFAVVALIMAAVGLAATLFPAWHATGSRPHAVLRDL
jgi:predicted permease